MGSSFNLKAVCESVENGWVQARIEEFPGVITTAPTLDEAKANLLDGYRSTCSRLVERTNGKRPQSRHGAKHLS